MNEQNTMKVSDRYPNSNEGVVTPPGLRRLAFIRADNNSIKDCVEKYMSDPTLPDKCFLIRKRDIEEIEAQNFSPSISEASTFYAGSGFAFVRREWVLAEFEAVFFYERKWIEEPLASRIRFKLNEGGEYEPITMILSFPKGDLEYDAPTAAKS